VRRTSSGSSTTNVDDYKAQLLAYRSQKAHEHVSSVGAAPPPAAAPPAAAHRARRPPPRARAIKTQCELASEAGRAYLEAVRTNFATQEPLGEAREALLAAITEGDGVAVARHARRVIDLERQQEASNTEAIHTLHGVHGIEAVAKPHPTHGLLARTLKCQQERRTARQKAMWGTTPYSIATDASVASDPPEDPAVAAKMRADAAVSRQLARQQPQQQPQQPQQQPRASHSPPSGKPRRRGSARKKKNPRRGARKSARKRTKRW
jgi:hypothetical protein